MLLAAGVAGQAVPTSAAAQNAEEQRTAVTLDEIIVTATRRSLSIQDAPVSIQAIPGEELEEDHINEVKELVEQAPGINFVSFSNINQNVAMRGSSSAAGDSSPAADQGVSVIVDDVVTAASSDNNPDLFDLDRVEILRGPQGTLFGRNTTGGIIAIYTASPTFDPKAKFQATYGSDNLIEARGVVSGPLAESIAGKLAISGRFRDGNVSKTQGGDIGAESIVTARGQLLFRPREELDVLVGVDTLQEDSDSTVLYLVGNMQPSLFPPIDYGFVSNAVSNGSTERDITGLVGRMNWRFAGMELTAISGYRDVHVSMDFDQIFSAPLVINHQFETQNAAQFTQEIRLASTGERRLDWTVGAYYLSGERDRESTILYELLPGSLVVDVLGASTDPFLSSRGQFVEITSYAGFGEASWHLTDRLTLTGGGRYTWEEKTGRTEATHSGSFRGGPVGAAFGKSWSAFTPKASVSFQATDDVLLFATAARGFKSGGFTHAGTVSGIQRAVNPEYVWNYEAGIKSDWLDRRLRLNATVYRMDYTDLQTRLFDPDLLITTQINAGQARVQGLELEVAASPLQGVSVGANYAYTDGKFVNFTHNGVDYSGRRVAQTPKNSLYLFADVTRPSPFGAGDIYFGGDITYKGKRYFDFTNADPDFVYDETDVEGVLNLRAGWKSSDDRWQVQVWGRNVTDERYYTLGADVAALYVSAAEFAAPPADRIYLTGGNEPASFGVTVTARWD